MKTLKLFIMLAISTLLLNACSCESDEGMVGTEVTIVGKNTMSFDQLNGGKDTIRIKNNGSINICGVWVYDASKDNTEWLCRTMLSNQHPDKIEADGTVYGTIEYDDKWDVTKITIDQYTIRRIYNDDGTKRNEYEVSVSPSAEPRRYRISIGVICEREGDFISPTTVDVE